MGSSKCFVPGCTTGYESDRKRHKALGKRGPSLFHPPRNPLLLHIWRQVIPRADKVISEKDGICELHFAEEDIQWYFPRELLPDGTEFYLKRERPNLKPGAIPTYFAKLPKYSSNLRKLVSKLPKHEFMKRTSPTLLAIEKELHNYYLKVPQSKDAKNAEISEFDANVSEIEKCRITYERRKVSEKGNKNLISEDIVDETSDETVAIGEESLYMSADNLSASTSDLENISEQNKNSEKMNVDDIHISTNNKNTALVGEVTYDVLVKNVGLIPKPNSSWGITAHDRFIICAKWNEEYMPEKRVIIDCSLNIKVYVRDKEIASYKNWTFSNLSDVTTIMHLIDS